MHVERETARLLSDWGISERAVRDAVRWAYENHVAEVTSDEPLNSRGTTMYLRLTGRLRQALRPEGWRIDRTGNLEMTVHPKGHLAIVVANGDQDTGVECRQPCTVSRKGARTKKVLGERLFDVSEFASATSDAHDRQMLVLLVHADERNQEIRCEISMPLGVADSGYIEEWSARAILRPIPMVPNPFGSRVADIEQTEPIEIPVPRRAVGE